MDHFDDLDDPCTGTHECGCAECEDHYRRQADEDGRPLGCGYF